MSNNTNLRAFIEKIMALGAGYTGMGGAQTGIIGSHSTETDVIIELRKQALALDAAAMHKEHGRIMEHAKGLEGALQSLYMISALSEEHLHKLIDELHDLTASLTP